MRSRLSQIAPALILLVCLISPIVEMFDRWDHTVQTGNDTEYALVLLGLCAGAAYAFARKLAAFVNLAAARLNPQAMLAVIACPSRSADPCLTVPISASPPISTLRI